MAATEAQVKVMIQDAIRIYDQIRLAAGVNSFTNSSRAYSNFVALQTTALADTFGDYATDYQARLQSTRSRLDSCLKEFGATIQPLLAMYALAINTVPETDPQSILTRLYDYFILNSYSITSRGFLFGAATAGATTVGGSNAGNGTVYRMAFDENGYVMENQHADTKNAICVVDASSGAAGRNEEIWELRGAAAARDSLVLSGSGARVQVAALSARAGASLVQNPSFSVIGGTPTVPTSIPSWNSSITVNASNFQYLTDATVPPAQGSNIYRDFPGDSVPYSLQCLSLSTWTLSQSLEVNRPNFLPGIPYFVQLAYKKSASGADGSLTIQIGSQTTAVSLSGISDTNWHTLVFMNPSGLSTPISGAWYKGFNSPNLTITLGRSSQTTGTIIIDDLIVSPMASFDGSWYAFVGGTTQWNRYDSFAWTDAEYALAAPASGGLGGIVQHWLWRALGRYLPALPHKPAAAPTAALAGAGAGNVDNGLHNYGFTYVDANGLESTLSPAGTATVADKTTNGKVSLSAITAGVTSQITQRWLYRTKVGAPTVYYQLDRLVDNTTTTYTDNIADASINTLLRTPQATATWITDPT